MTVCAQGVEIISCVWTWDSRKQPNLRAFQQECLKKKEEKREHKVRSKVVRKLERQRNEIGGMKI